MYKYECYNSDFGPLNLAQLHRFCKEVDSTLRNGQKVVHACSTQFAKQANAVFLHAGFLLIVKGYSINKIADIFGSSYLDGLVTFRDAGVGPDDFPLTVIDCLKGLQRAIELDFYSYSKFDLYDFERMLEQGDLSWVVQNQIIAFSSPTSHHGGRYSAGSFRPDDLVDSF